MKPFQAMPGYLRSLCAALLGLAAGSAFALNPEQIFEKVSPSVWAVRSLDAAGRPINNGSGVVIGPGRIVTNCHVLARAKAVQVRREKLSHEAALEHADPERDLCTLTVKDFNAPAVAVSELAGARIGQRVYTVGNPEGLALTLSEGLISGLRSEDPRLPPIQTSAPISPGSSGGGLFDSEGRLLGITTAAVLGRRRIAQNLNFAVPAEWIAEVPARAAAALAARTVAAAAAPGLPAASASYRYEWTERQFFLKQTQFRARVTGVEGSRVSEALEVEGGAAQALDVEARQPRFFARMLGSGKALTEFAPYLAPKGPNDMPQAAESWHYPADGDGPWTVSASSMTWDQVTVPAGSFRALQLRITGSRTTSARASRANVAERFEFTVWYAPEVNRYVKLVHQQWSRADRGLLNEQVELLERPAPATAAKASSN
jgi:hypothetical protein